VCTGLSGILTREVYTRGMRLLLLEDDPRLHALIVTGLREAGHSVEGVTTARLAYNVAMTDTFDALILDVMLPEGEDAGFLLARRLREEGQRTPILFLTARSDVESRLQGLEVGDDHLGKPFDFRELRSRLAGLVRRAAGQARSVLPLPGGRGWTCTGVRCWTPPRGPCRSRRGSSSCWRVSRCTRNGRTRVTTC